MHRLAIATVTVLLVSSQALAKDEPCTFGVDCYCDRVRDPSDALYDPALLLCEDFEDPAYDDGGLGWSNVNGPPNDNCLINGPDWNTNGSIEGTCPTCCVNVVKEGACEATDENDCVWQGTQTLGHRLQPGKTGGIVGGRSFTRSRTFGITYAMRYSPGYVDPTVAQKTDELGDGLHCFLGCSTFNSTGRNVPFQAVFFTSGAANTGTLLAGEQGPNDGFFNFSPSPADYEWRTTHGPGQWVCHQIHFDGWGLAGATIRYWIDGKLVVHIADFDMSNVAYDPDGIGSIAWNHYYNDGYTGTGVAYRYEDNVHITAAPEPISCEAIGLGPSPSTTGAGGTTSSSNGAGPSATVAGAGGGAASATSDEATSGCACRSSSVPSDHHGWLALLAALAVRVRSGRRAGCRSTDRSRDSSCRRA